MRSNRAVVTLAQALGATVDALVFSWLVPVHDTAELRVRGGATEPQPSHRNIPSQPKVLPPLGGLGRVTWSGMRLRIARAGTDSIEASAVPSAVRGARA